MSVAAFSPFGRVKFIDNFEFSLLMPGDNHLGNPFAIVDDKVLSREVHQKNHYLTTIVGIDSARSVEDGYSMLQSQPAARANLCFESCRQGNMQSCRNETALHRVESYRLVDVCTEIHTCALWSGVGWKLLVTGVNYFYFNHCYRLLLIRQSVIDRDRAL